MSCVLNVKQGFQLAYYAVAWAAAVASSDAAPPVATRSLPVTPRRAQPPPSPARSLGGSVSRSSSIALPELQKQLTEGVRPGWNLELAGVCSSSSSQARPRAPVHHACLVCMS